METKKELPVVPSYREQTTPDEILSATILRGIKA
jgi:hypothetical protein